MKSIKKYISAIAFFLLLGNGHAQILKAELVASGLTCSMCSFATQKQLKTLSFIDSIGTDLNHTTFVLYFKKNQAVDVEQVKNKVEAAGFSVASLILTFHFKNVKADEKKPFDYDNASYFITNGENKILDGDLKVKVTDKGFVSSKEFKKNKTTREKEASKEAAIPAAAKKIFHLMLV